MKLPEILINARLPVETFTGAYLFQIALEIMRLPIETVIAGEQKARNPSFNVAITNACATVM